MPQKRCIIFSSQPFRTNNPFDGGTVFSFPKDHDEQRRYWKSGTLTDKEGQICRNVGVSYKHSPPNSAKDFTRYNKGADRVTINVR